MQFPDRLVRGHRNDVDGQHQVAGKACQVLNQRVLDVAGKLPEIQHPAILLAQAEMILPEGHGVRADGILEAASGAHGFFEIKGKLRFLPGPVKVVEDSEPGCGVQILALGIQPG